MRMSNGSTRHSMSRTRRAGLILGAALFASAATTITASTAQAGQDVGGIDLNRYCQATSDWGPSDARLYPGGNTVFDWKCTDLNDQGQVIKYSGIDVHAACRFTHGRDDVHANYYDQNNPYSWYCETN